MINRSELKTEQQNKNSENIDSMSISEIIKVINEEDHKVASVVKSLSQK